MSRDLRRRLERAAERLRPPKRTDIVVELVTLEPNPDGSWPEPPDGRVVITFEDGRTWREGDP
jgi:hypothetical protein